MSYEVYTLPEFDKRAKALAKRFISLKKDLGGLVALLGRDPIQGTPLGRDCYKVRMRITSKGRGKSGGARVITCIRIVEHQVWLLTIYDKSDKENITIKELGKLVAQVP